ncbi:MAG: hypothetical protein LBQ68_09915, partial [Clostridiales bacterium]|nr:hypothetical protein [Clostridiales bacterium]
MDNFLQLAPTIETAILSTRPERVLEISAHSPKYGRLIADCQKRLNIQNPVIDRVIPEDLHNETCEQVYTRILPVGTLDNLENIESYDFILVLNLLENMDSDQAHALVQTLCAKAKLQLLVVLPGSPFNFLSEVLSEDNFYSGSPAQFLDFD